MIDHALMEESGVPGEVWLQSEHGACLLHEST